MLRKSHMLGLPTLLAIVLFSVPVWTLDRSPDESDNLSTSGSALDDAPPSLSPPDHGSTYGSSPSQFCGIQVAGNATTSWDVQRYGSGRTQITTLGGSGNYVHVSWTSQESYDFHDLLRAVRYDAYDWHTESWLCAGAVIGEFNQRGGGPTIGVNSDAKPVVGFHYRWHQEGMGDICLAEVATFPVLGLCLHTTENLNDDSWTIVGIARNESPNSDVYHVATREADDCGDSPYYLAYWRYVDVGGGYVWQGPVIMDEVFNYAHTLFVDGDRVIYAFAKPRDYVTEVNEYNNDLAYYESTVAGADWIANNGANWQNGDGWNVTSYCDQDLHRCFTDIAGGFTSDGTLHLLYTNPRYENGGATVSDGPTQLLHWAENTPGGNSPAMQSGTPCAGFNPLNFDVVRAALWQNAGSAGKWNLNLAKMTMGIGDGSTDCDGEPNLDYLYVVYTQFGSENPLGQADVSASGMQNADLWMSISRDGGDSWAAGLCLTTENCEVGGPPTRTPGCDDPGGNPCRSEHWSSVAPVVNDTLHVFYIGDTDAGAAPLGEGNWSTSPVMYMPIFDGALTALQGNPLCPVIAPVLDVYVQCNPDCDYYADGANPIDYDVLSVGNIGNGQLDFWIDINYVSGSDWLRLDGSSTIPPTSIPPGNPSEEYEVMMDGTSLANGQYQADIRVHHNAAGSDPYIIPITFEVNISGCDCGVWGDVTGDGEVNPLDVTFIQQFVFFMNDMRTQPPNCPLEAGDVANCEGMVNPQDVVFMQQYVYFTNDMFCGDPCQACEGPELRPQSFTLSGQQSASPGEELQSRIAATVENIGGSDAGEFFVGFYISVDGEITTSDQLLIGGIESISGVPAGNSVPVPINGPMTIPGDWPLGPAYLGIIIDINDAVSECDESDNTAAIPITIVE